MIYRIRFFDFGNWIQVRSLINRWDVFHLRYLEWDVAEINREDQQPGNVGMIALGKCARYIMHPLSRSYSNCVCVDSAMVFYHASLFNGDITILPATIEQISSSLTDLEYISCNNTGMVYKDTDRHKQPNQVMIIAPDRRESLQPLP